LRWLFIQIWPRVPGRSARRKKRTPLAITFSRGAPRAAAAIVSPMARGPFALTLRAYLPELDLLQGRYRPPPVEPIR